MSVQGIIFNGWSKGDWVWPPVRFSDGNVRISEGPGHSPVGKRWGWGPLLYGTLASARNGSPATTGLRVETHL